jgi:hypothetical protein
MKLFEIDENSEVKINAPWIRLIPEFKTLFDSGSKKLAWDKNTYAKKLLAYIYFVRDFSSPLRDWEPEARAEEALRYTELTPADISTPKMVTALEYYSKLQYEACRALKTYEASLAGLTAMDDYLKTVDFDQRDKMGKLLYTPNQYVANLALTDKAYDILDKLANRVAAQLEQSTGMRGKADMGDREKKMTQGDFRTDVTWDENVIAPDGSTKWQDIQGLLHKKKKTDEDVA